MKNRFEIDMCNGPLLGKILSYVLPLMFANILQLLFNAADQVVVGRYAQDGTAALAAVGAPGTIISLLVLSVGGLATGSTVVVSHAYGKNDEASMSRALHTSVLVALAGGAALGLIGVVFAEPLVSIMNCPENIFDGAVLYTRIYFSGVPALLLYNFGAAVLRAVGDTRRPFWYLACGGICNVLLNLLLVVVFHLDVAGVAIATVVSQVISACLVTRCLLLEGGAVQLDFRKLRFHRKELARILRIGIPAGMNSALYAVANVLIASTVNGFGDAIIAGNGASLGVEGFVTTSFGAFGAAATNFVSQNLGAGKLDRVKRSVGIISFLTVGTGLVLGVAVFFSREFLVAIYQPDNPDVIAAGALRLAVVSLFYFCLALTNVISGATRGLGYSLVPALNSLFFVCTVRILWLYVVFPLEPTYGMLTASYPVSWLLSSIGDIVCYLVVLRKTEKKLAQ